MASTTLTLDPLHPSLDHHRPGKFPLFGTAMGIGAMLAAGREIGLHGDACRIDVVRVNAPYILDHGGPHRLVVDLATSGQGVVRSPSSSSDGEVVHFEGHIRQPSPLGPWQAPALPDLAGLPCVDQSQVYEAFFHGPAFQVIGAAKFCEPVLFSSHSGADWTRRIPWDSRVIEFAMQSAGLLELALSGRMMIPSGIDRLEIFVGEPVNDAQPIYAHVTQHAESTHTSCSNISVWTEPTLLVARISGYRTAALPFPIETRRVADLQQHLVGAPDVTD